MSLKPAKGSVNTNYSQGVNSTHLVNDKFSVKWYSEACVIKRHVQKT